MQQKRPFFIVGAGRSGTTFLFTLLAAHPKVALTNEARLIHDLDVCRRFASLPAGSKTVIGAAGVEVHGLVNMAYHRSVEETLREFGRLLLSEFYMKEFHDRAFTHWGDKMPGTPAEVLETLIALHPEARFLVPVRDPRDYVCSYQALADQRQANLRGTSSLEDRCAHWIEQYRHWVETPQTQLVRYEQFITTPAATLRQALEFLGLEHHPECDKALMRAAESFASSGTSRSPLASIGRWEGELQTEDVIAIESACRPVMTRLGYAPSLS